MFNHSTNDPAVIGLVRLFAAQKQIEQKYQSLGGLGIQTSPGIERIGDGYVVEYEGGAIFYSRNTFAREVHGEILKKYKSLGGAGGFLGFPLTDEKPTSMSSPVHNQAYGTGRYNHFQNGSIYWRSASGAYEVHGAIRELWHSWGGTVSGLGFPLSDEMDTQDGSGRVGFFDGGSLTWVRATGQIIYAPRPIR